MRFCVCVVEKPPHFSDVNRPCTELYIPGNPRANQGKCFLTWTNVDHDVLVEDVIFQHIGNKEHQGGTILHR